MDAPLVSVDQTIAQLDGELPEELKGPAPREIPEAIKEGRLYRKNRNAVWIMAVLGLACLLGDGLPFVQTLALYFLPLGYLLWIGIFLCLCAAYGYLFPRELKRAKRYIEQGRAGFGRVTGLIKKPTAFYHGQATNFAMVAQVETQHPELGVPCVREITSAIFTTKSKSTRFHVGDVVPLVWLPGQFDKTATIYDFLEVMPGHDLVDRSEPVPAWKAIVLALSIASMVFGLLWALYTHGRYEPIDFRFQQAVLPFSIGAGVGLVIAIWLTFVHTRNLEKVAKRNAEAGIVDESLQEKPARHPRLKKIGTGIGASFGGVVLGGLLSLGAAFTVNVLFDKSPSKLVAVVIIERVQITHKFIFREYEMKYHRMNEQKVHSLQTTPQHLDQFAVPLGIARIRSGWLGWPWVETIDPIQPAQAAAGKRR